MTGSSLVQIIGAERVRGKSGVCVYVARGWKEVKANTHTRPGLFLLTYTKKKLVPDATV